MDLSPISPRSPPDLPPISLLGGCYAIEGLGDEIEAGAEACLSKIEALGGMVAAIEAGYVQREIQNSAYEFQKKVETGEETVVGVNRYVIEEEKPTPILKIDPRAEQRRVAELDEFKRKRDPDKVKRVLERVRETAAGRENLTPAVLAAVESLATLGEISDALREVFGVYRERVAW